ncbi:MULTISPECIES: nuclear transport factor 2 family protein [Cupriavidus]|uniref:Nuclear transport factor 2 family protein n=1 Tax=Cupriavidus basilensis TaxID=68895 RepID=A0A643G4S7_9BURK|nr:MULTISPECIES: nuclear transport factor 2 family protein [Cupriavidus]NOV23798.1 nuclear transport factor 2 family protein [Cupriavidus necator]QOT81846.1 nuclear transport factor 2 family protein [Cupriavidus basilensis]BDB30294.1 nuclear transport factor 2 family protein [Cupriavidus sp. P-10]
MSSTVTRHQLLDLLAAFCDTWAGRPSMPAEDLLADAVELFSSHRGHFRGAHDVLGALASDFPGLEAVHIAATNRVPRAYGSESMVSAYFHGEARQSAGNAEAVAFGGVVILSFESQGSRARIREIRIQLHWVHGESARLTGWQLPPTDRAWQPGDPPAVVVSELDAPWHRIPVSELATSNEEAAAEAWFRYAWALDQADFVLFGQCFSEDAEAELTPMGHLKGRRELMATLKAFRLPWPWMQHYGEPLQVEIQSDGSSAALLLGRVMPGRTTTPENKPLYGAHYRIQLIKDDGETWRIGQMAYVPGWFSV